MTMEGHEVNVIDISLGGVKVGHCAPLTLSAGTIVNLSLYINEKEYPLQAKIVTTSADTGTARDSFTSTQFLYVSKTLESVLFTKIQEIERETRSLA
jgi:hypothetical protein